MIDVKAARRTQEAPTSAQIYAQGVEAKPARSRIAVVLVGAVIALASFVRARPNCGSTLQSDVSR